MATSWNIDVGLDLTNIARRQTRFHYKLRNTHLLVHLECMLAGCEIYVGVVGSRLAARKLT